MHAVQARRTRARRPPRQVPAFECRVQSDLERSPIGRRPSPTARAARSRTSNRSSCSSLLELFPDVLRDHFDGRAPARRAVPVAPIVDIADGRVVLDVAHAHEAARLDLRRDRLREVARGSASTNGVRNPTRTESGAEATSVARRDCRALSSKHTRSRSSSDRSSRSTASTSTIRPGEAFGFLGPNGAGKTSTMRMIGCVSPVTDGRPPGARPRPGHDGPAIRGRHRRRAAGRQPRHRAHGVGQPPHLRPLLRPAPPADQGAGRGAARLRAAHRPARLEGRSALGRHEAPAHDRTRRSSTSPS